MNHKVNLIVRVEGKLWLMESVAASYYPDVIETVDTVVSLCYKTREAIGQSGTRFRVYIDNSVGVSDVQ